MGQRADLVQQVVHAPHFVLERRGAHGADGDQSQPAHINLAGFHAGIGLVHQRRRPLGATLVGAIGSAVHDEDAVEPALEGAQIEVGVEHRRADHRQHVGVGGVLGVDLAHAVGPAIAAR